MTNDLVESLKPRGERFDKEDFSNYKKRVARLLPYFPDCVLEQWIYRHHGFYDNYAYNIGLERMRFKEEDWDTDKIYNDVKSFNDNTIDGLGFHFYNKSTKSWLKNYMATFYTFPVPIIILKNDKFEDMGKPFHLIEGHQRLNYFRAIYSEEKEKLQRSHKVWVVSLVE